MDPIVTGQLLGIGGQLLNGLINGGGPTGGAAPTNGGNPVPSVEWQRQLDMTDPGNVAYKEWCKKYDLVKYQSGRVWDTLDGSQHTVYWWRTNVWGPAMAAYGQQYSPYAYTYAFDAAGNVDLNALGIAGPMPPPPNPVGTGSGGGSGWSNWINGIFGGSTTFGTGGPPQGKPTQQAGSSFSPMMMLFALGLLAWMYFGTKRKRAN